jgi:hypothetical protein
MIEPIAESDAVEQIARAYGERRAIDAGRYGERGHKDVVDRRELRQEQMILKHEANVRAAERCLRALAKTVRIVAVDRDRAG